jgi:hypothetical protein
MKSEIEVVIENKDIKRMILSMSIKLFEEFMEMVNKNPNRNPAKVVKMALSFSTVP